MIDVSKVSDLVSQLQDVLANADIPKAPRTAGERLLKRLTSDISVVLAGPEVDAKEYLHDVLAQTDLPQTSVAAVTWQDPLPSEQADICIWCTAAFDLEEAKQWQAMPDRLKDHSFLVVFSEMTLFDSKLDQVDLNRLADIAAEEFYALSHVNFGNRATTAQPDTVKALVQEVAKKVRMGLAADADNAELFVRTYQVKSRAAVEVSTAEQPTPEVPSINSPNGPNPASDVFKGALDVMSDHIAGLEPLLNAQEETDFQKVLNICEETMSSAVDVLEGSDIEDPELALIKDETLSATDTITLMSMEGGAGPAVCAVYTVLQLRREMELQIAC